MWNGTGVEEGCHYTAHRKRKVKAECYAEEHGKDKKKKKNEGVTRDKKGGGRATESVAHVPKKFHSAPKTRACICISNTKGTAGIAFGLFNCAFRMIVTEQVAI
jgi:hypothetical protein